MWFLPSSYYHSFWQTQIFLRHTATALSDITPKMVVFVLVLLSHFQNTTILMAFSTILHWILLPHFATLYTFSVMFLTVWINQHHFDDLCLYPTTTLLTNTPVDPSTALSKHNHFDNIFINFTLHHHTVLQNTTLASPTGPPEHTGRWLQAWQYA